MALQLRQPLSTARIETLIEEAIHARGGPTFYRDTFKRGLDMILVLAMALPALLVIALFAALIACDGHSPIYLQKRVGRNGRRFDIWKLRSMVPDAEDRLQAHLARDTAARMEWDRSQKLQDDPRITRLGQFIRKTSIDELPQLWNVLRGDMSLVGPRPMMPSQQEIYPGSAYYAIRPGITGFWQVSVRNESSFSQRAEFDTAYLRAMSLKTDLQVLARTVRVVFHGTGC